MPLLITITIRSSISNASSDCSPNVCQPMRRSSFSFTSSMALSETSNRLPSNHLYDLTGFLRSLPYHNRHLTPGEVAYRCASRPTHNIAARLGTLSVTIRRCRRIFFTDASPVIGKPRFSHAVRTNQRILSSSHSPPTTDRILLVSEHRVSNLIAGKILVE